MLWLPPVGYREVQTNLPATPSTATGTNAPAAAVAHTKGTLWTELLASTNFETEWLVVNVSATFASATRTDALLDIGVGAAASESVLIPNLLAGWAANGGSSTPRSVCIPVYIPKGTRVSARSQSIVASRACYAGVSLYGGAKNAVMPTFSGCDAIGVTSSGASQGTSVTAGNSGADGAWTNVGSPTARDYKALVFLAQGSLATTAMTALAYHFEVGFSSTALAKFFVGTNTAEYTTGPYPMMPIFHSVPAGTQLQVRGRCSGTAQPLDVALYGLS